jgi:hypothetical protein
MYETSRIRRRINETRAAAMDRCAEHTPSLLDERHSVGCKGKDTEHTEGSEPE